MAVKQLMRSEGLSCKEGRDGARFCPETLRIGPGATAGCWWIGIHEQGGTGSARRRL